MSNINPLIALQTQAPDASQATRNALTNVNAFNQIRENQQTSGLRKQQALSEADLAGLKSDAIIGGQIIPMLEANDIEGTRTALTSRRDQLKKLGLNTNSLDRGLVMLDQDPSGQALLKTANDTVKLVGMFDKHGVSAGLAEFQALTKDLSPADQDKARRIELGLDPRAMGSAAITTATTGLTEKVAESEGVIAGSKAGASKSAELDAQLEKLPAVKAAVTAAQERIKNEVELESIAKKNAITLDMYNTSIKSLEDALGNIDTGPVTGKLPAVTSGQQIAEGTISAAAPILKALFRSAGEGTFTDKDQELLTGMLPTRSDHQETIKSKINNINAIVRAKLGAQNQTSQDDPLGILQ